MPHQQGFTSIELILVLFALAVLMTLGTSQYLSTLGAFKRLSSLNHFESDVRRARIESITQGGRGIIQPDASGKGYAMGIDYWPFAETAVIESQLFTTDFGNEIGFEASDKMIFNSRGFLVNESGIPTTVTFRFTFRGGEFCSGSVYSSGIMEMTCR